MRYRADTLILPLVALLLVACERPEPSIEQSSVERIMTTLSADEMMGREAFTPGAAMAVNFIAGEFAEIGLDHFAELEDYRQSFPIYSLTPAESRISVNGRAITEDRMATRVSAQALDWTQDSDVEVVLVGRDDNPMRAAMGAFRAEGNTLVLMHTAHRQAFDRIRGFLSGPTRALDFDGASSVFVLSNTSEVSSFDVEVSAIVEELSLTNVVGVIPGRRADEYVLFGAHHDHIGVLEPVDGDSIANGANDDASGVTAVIELARYYKALGRPTRTLVFVAFAAEEKGLIGSQHFSTLIPAEQVVALFNIEMIGKVGPYGDDAAWITGFEHSDFGQILQSSAEGTEFSFNPDQPETNLFFSSDNAPFARLGIPAHSISTTDINDDDYHQVSDEIETLDLVLMTNTIRAIARAARSIVSGEDTPTRIDVESLN